MPFFPHFEFTSLVQLIGYPGIAAIIFTETGLFFGFFLPGASLLFTAGIVSAFGFFNIWLLLLIVIIAAILGDNVGYLFGAKVGMRLFSRPDSHFFKQKHVDQTRIYFEKYGTRTILLARFVPIVRTFASILLGIIALTFIPLIVHWWRREKVSRLKICPRIAIFDLDDTLTESFKPPKPEIVEKIKALLELMPVAIMSAAGFRRIEREFLPTLSKSPFASRLYLFPNSTAQGFLWKEGTWTCVYNNELTEGERVRIKRAIEESVAETGALKGVVPHGPQMIDRGAQIAFAAIGIDASDESKKSWDVDKTKRKKLRKTLRKKIPGFEIMIGGRTTIDITRKGINKAHGVRWLSRHLDIKPKEMLYVGDALYPGGNDAAVIPTGIRTISTSGPVETESIIDDLQKTCSVR